MLVEVGQCCAKFGKPVPERDPIGQKEANIGQTRLSLCGISAPTPTFGQLWGNFWTTSELTGITGGNFTRSVASNFSVNSRYVTLSAATGLDKAAAMISQGSCCLRCTLGAEAASALLPGAPGASELSTAFRTTASACVLPRSRVTSQPTRGGCLESRRLISKGSFQARLGGLLWRAKCFRNLGQIRPTSPQRVDPESAKAGPISTEIGAERRQS